MDRCEINTFISKFYQLWHSGHEAHLDIDTKAGQAWVGLRVHLGHAPERRYEQGASTHQRKTRNNPARQRRRDRRAAERQAQQENVIRNDTQTVEVYQEADAEEASVETVEETHAAEASSTLLVEEGMGDTTAELAAQIEEVEENHSTTSEFECKFCDCKFKNKRGFSTHQGRMHKVIPQVDGQSEDLPSEITFSFISHYGKYDVEYTLEELFPEAFNAKLVSRKKVEHEKNANHICIVTLETACDELFTWPEMNNIQKEVITRSS